MPLFDAMRVLAALAVVCTHTPEIGIWKRVTSAMQFGVSFFTIAALILLARSIGRRPEQTFLAYTSARVRRIAVPLLLWSAIYVAFFWLMHRAFGTRVWGYYELRTRGALEIMRGFLLGGAAIHLWFLPFILATCVGAFGLLKLAHQSRFARQGLVATMVILGALAVVALHWAAAKSPGGSLSAGPLAHFDRGTRLFLEYSLWTLPTLFWAIAIAMVYPKNLSDRAAAIMAALGAILFIVSALAAWNGVQSPAIRAAKGVAVAMMALSHWSPRFVQVLARWGMLSFGVYLVHLLFVTLIRELGYKAGMTGGRIWFYPAVALAAFMASYACTMVMSRHRLGRLLFP